MEHSKRTQTRADLMLLMVTFCWGVSYLLIRGSIQAMGVFTLNTYRFLCSGLLIMLITFPRFKKISKTTVKYAVIIGICLYVTYLGCTYGVMYTSLSNAAFLSGMAVVTTPVIAFFKNRTKPDRKLFFVILLCVVGIALMTLNEELGFASGDILCLLCAVAYGFDAVLTDDAVQKDDVDPYQLGVLSLVSTGVFCLVTALVLETPVLPKEPGLIMSVAFLAFFCKALPFIIQPIAQQYTTATHLGVIFTIEPVFAAIVAFAFAGERLLPRGYVGAVILLLGMLLMEVDFKNPGKTMVKEKMPEGE